MKTKFRTLAFMIILSVRVVTRNLTVLFTITGLNSAAKRLKADTMADALITQVATFGVMSPTTAIVKGMVQDGKDIATARANAELLIKSLVVQEKNNAALIVKTIRDGWLGTIKTKADGDVDLVFGVGASIRGMGTPPDKTRFGRTWPEVISVDQNIPMRISLDLIGNDVIDRAKPWGAVSIGCYRQVGGVAPLRNNHPLATLVIPFSTLKFSEIFVAGQENLKVYYIWFWIDKDGNTGPESPVFPYTITS